MNINATNTRQERFNNTAKQIPYLTLQLRGSVLLTQVRHNENIMFVVDETFVSNLFSRLTDSKLVFQMLLSHFYISQTFEVIINNKNAK